MLVIFGAAISVLIAGAAGSAIMVCLEAADRACDKAQAWVTDTRPVKWEG